MEIVDSRAEFLEPWSSDTVDEGDVLVLEIKRVSVDEHLNMKDGG